MTESKKSKSEEREEQQEKEFEENMKNYFEKKFTDKFEKKFAKCGEDSSWDHNKNNGAMGGGFYFLFFVGAAVYYIGTATTFWIGVLGVLKALVWPAMLGYEIFSRLGM